MPELPEVETIRLQLSKLIKNQTITVVKIRFNKKIEPRQNFKKLLEGQKILNIFRRGKLLIFKLSGGLNLVIHLKMTGKLLFKKDKEKPSKHTHIIFHLSGGNELHWEDVRKFGYLKLLTNHEIEKLLKKLNYGPEPLNETFNVKQMIKCLRRHPNSTIKPLIMNPSCIAGIGNIYAMETLWMSKIHPLTKIKYINDAEIYKLYKNIITILKKAIKYGGTSSDNYLDAYGKKGNFTSQLKVYNKTGTACSRCKTELKKIRVGGRGTVICNKCQKNKNQG